MKLLSRRYVTIRQGNGTDLMTLANRMNREANSTPRLNYHGIEEGSKEARREQRYFRLLALRALQFAQV